MFEGIRGNSYTGDIALDDISFTVSAVNCIYQPPDALPPNMTTAAPPVTTTSAVSPTTIGTYGLSWRGVHCLLAIKHKSYLAGSMRETGNILRLSIEFCHECRSLIGYATHYLFCDR